VIRKADTFLRQPVDIGRADIRSPEGRKVAVAEVISQDENNMRSRSLFGSNATAGKCGKAANY
jgi:hypothetical protein